MVDLALGAAGKVMRAVAAMAAAVVAEAGLVEEGMVPAPMVVACWAEELTVVARKAGVEMVKVAAEEGCLEAEVRARAATGAVVLVGAATAEAAAGESGSAAAKRVLARAAVGGREVVV